MKLKTGMLFLDERGGGYSDEGPYICFNIFEYRENLDNGAGGIYCQDEKPTDYKWSFPKEKFLLQKVPDEIMFSFKHGSYGFNIQKSKLEKCSSPTEIIQNSDFRHVTQKDVADAVKLTEIKTIEQIKENWDFIKSGNFNTTIAETVFNSIGVKVSPCVNGEIGIWTLGLYSGFFNNINVIENKLFKGNHA